VTRLKVLKVLSSVCLKTCFYNEKQCISI